MLVTRNFPPLLGGMEKVNQHLLEAMLKCWRMVLCGPAGCSAHAFHTDVRESRARPLLVFLLLTLWHAVRLARHRRPEWIVAGSGLVAPIVWLAARCSGGRTAVYLHGLDVVAPNRIYQRLWLPFIRRCDLVLVNSTNTARLAADRGVAMGKMQVLHPGTDLPALDASVGDRFRESHELGRRPLLLSVGRLTQRKGLVEFVTKAMPVGVARYPDALLVVIGGEASEALHARPGSERERILVAAHDAGVERNLRFLGRCDEATLMAAYQAADLHIFPVLESSGDVEGFGMVALEAAAHGLPTVAFAVGGVADAVQEGRTGTLVDSGDYAALAATVMHRLTRRRGNDVVAACREFAAGKAWPVFDERLRCLLEASHA
jgi:phosphatidylinositol alpha-1,6-mannosyltransferase